MPAPPAPYLNPQTLQPMGPADLAPLFPQAIIAQEVSAEPWIEIPDQVREVYKIWRRRRLYGSDQGGRRPVGIRSGVRRGPVQPRGHRLHGQGLVRAETLPPGDDGNLGRNGARVAEQPHQRRTRDPGGRS